ncbi:hypothetical protein L2E82_39379 [Cichorium intybus]|uniref:Uncharacterized protein n=1 Tax=Cichorium intybus TaxID=13427 RepID=A0ACB9AIU6_CICIN|nr:hypothetical protein L2E82_39379 [Cichorium intybus]
MSGWHEVRRRRGSAVMATRGDSSLSSFFVKNLPGDVSKQELWGPCSKLGCLADIYIAGRRDASGSFFAFIRYDKVQDVESIEAGLNKVVYRGRKLVANVAKHPRPLQEVMKRRQSTNPTKFVPPSSRDSRSFSDVLKGQTTIQPPSLSADTNLVDIKDIREWAEQDTLIGEVKNFDTLCNFPSLFSLEGFDIVECKYAGGMQVVIKFVSVRAAEIFKANKNIWLKWFIRIELFGGKIARFERIAWIKIMGVPILAWDEEDFEEGEIRKTEPGCGDGFPAKDSDPGVEGGAVGMGCEASPTMSLSSENKSPPRNSEPCSAVGIGEVTNQAGINCNYENGTNNPSAHIGINFDGPVANGPDGCSTCGGPCSSPDFEPGDSAVKRRRTKKKKNKDPVYIESSNGARNSPSIDLNKCAISSQCSSQPNRLRISPSRSFSESSSEVGRTIDIGNQVGFQVEIGNGAVLEAFNGGGAKIGKT